MNTMYEGNSTHPFHFSVGVVLRRADGKVCVHHFVKGDPKMEGYWTNEGCEGIYLLMRKTIRQGEGLVEAALRGLMEEFGATGEVADYLGTLVTHFDHNGTSVEKTTAYFLVEMTSQDDAARTGTDIEAHTKIEWHDPPEMIVLMKEQGKRFNRTDIDESSILERSLALTAP